MWVITAGSVMHMIIALAIVTGVYATWGRVEETGRVMISDVEPGTPAAQAGMSPDDVVLAIDGRPTPTSTEFRATLASFAPGSAHRFSIDREGITVELTATLVAHPDFPDEQRGYLGVRSFSADRVQQPLTDVIVEGPRDLAVALGQATVGVVKVLNPVNVWGHLTGTNNDPTTRPGTIIGATRLSDDAGEFEGWPGVLFMLAAVNVSVGVFNMFPLLPLDGGHAAIATYERLRSRGGRRYRADISKMMPVAAISIALLAFMFLTGLYLDTVKF
jgi:membrane-associated protease RseP (regulator of RpoE activity)